MESRYTKLEISLRYYLLGARYIKALKALDLVLRYHQGFRKDGVTPEAQHPIEIALYVSTLKDLIDEEKTITVALLHDLQEDYPASWEDMRKMFDNEILYACELLNKHGKKLDFYIDNMKTNHLASIVKGADRIHNVNSMVGVFTKEKQKIYIEEVKLHFLPMLRHARTNFPGQMQSYFNIMTVLRGQVGLLGEDL